MAINGISTIVIANDPVATKKKRREEKLKLAKTKRETVGTNGYRPLHTLTGTHTQYVGTTTSIVDGTASPTPGHPWS